MKKILLATILLAFTAVTANADVGMKQFGKIKSKETILTGLEAGNGITIEGEYKISANSYVGMSYKTEDITTSFEDDEFVKVKNEADGKIMHIYGHARYSISVTNRLTDVDLVVLHMPTTPVGGVKQWMLEFVNEATFAAGHAYTVLYAKTEIGGPMTYYFMSPDDFKNGKSFSAKQAFAVVFNDLVGNTYLVQSCELKTSAE